MILKNAIDKAEQLKSKLTPEYIKKLDGLSTPKVWHLLNNIVAQHETYLEVGVFKGSTLMAALYGNNPYAVAVDDFSMAPETREEFFNNTKGLNYTFLEGDCFKLDLKKIEKPIQVYFYDGNHSPESQYNAIKYFLPAMADEFIYICDDYDRKKVSVYTHEVIRDLELEKKGFWYLEGVNGWWNGIGIMKLKKK